MGLQSTFEEFESTHESYLETYLVPQHYWRSIYDKITNEVFDAGDVFTLLKVDYETEARGECDPVWQLQMHAEKLVPSDPQNVFLVDHAWSFGVKDARKQLLALDSLRERMGRIMGVDEEHTAKEEVVERIFSEMWKYCNGYSFVNADTPEERLPVWYVMDELGSAIQHSDTPNFRLVPFMTVHNHLAYNLIFPLRDVKQFEFVTRNYIEGPTLTSEERAALLLPWVPSSFIEYDFNHEDVTPEYFLSGHVKETLPNLALKSKIHEQATYRVFSEYEFICKYLTSAHFEIVDTEDAADILWYTKHFKAFAELADTPWKLVNQFPFEYVLTIKDLLPVTCRRGSNKAKRWLPVTYNLKTELVEFVSYFQYRKQKDRDNNVWIIKPFNLARGLDIHITDNFNYILRLPATGPKIAQKYIENPVLFMRPECKGRVKFDIRYVLLLKSVKPLVAYAYKNFFLRFANKPFALTSFDCYEQHFTVMNYNEEATLKHMLCADFKEAWREQYPRHEWGAVEARVLEMLREVFECAVLEEPPCGIAHSPQSRALYAVDLMLEWDQEEMQPMLLEVNWTPDCTRACEYYPDFYNDIFTLLFLDEDHDSNTFHKLF